MRLSFDTNNYFHTTVSLGVVTFLFFRFVPHSTQLDLREFCILRRDLKIPNAPKSSSCGVGL